MIQKQFWYRLIILKEQALNYQDDPPAYCIPHSDHEMISSMGEAVDRVKWECPKIRTYKSKALIARTPRNWTPNLWKQPNSSDNNQL